MPLPPGAGHLPLFDEEPPPGGLFDRAGLASKLAGLAAEGIYLGGSSWKYEGWLGQIYSPERYYVRGRFSQKRFEESCLAEYAETFPIVCGDFSFYQFPTAEFWKKLFETGAAPLRFAFKVPEEITVKVFPAHPRYGARAGLPNPGFLNADLLEAGFLEPLRPYGERVAVLIFEFGAFSKKAFGDPEEFYAALDRFLVALPGDFRFAVEIRNADYLTPEYFGVLREHGVAHVFNAWSRMPPIEEQVAREEAFTAGFTVARALLRAGRVYEEAVAQFAPYQRVQDPNPEARAALRALIAHARRRKQPAYLFINNRLEGNAPSTMAAVVD